MEIKIQQEKKTVNEKNENGQSMIFYKILQLLMKIPVLQNIRILFFFYDNIVSRFVKNRGKTVRKKSTRGVPFCSWGLYFIFGCD